VLVPTLYNLLLLFTGGVCALSLAGAALQWLFVVAYFGSGFGALETAVLIKGDLSPEKVRKFLALNNPVTVLCVLLLLASCSCLVWMKV
jgi:hypothetical protein